LTPQRGLCGLTSPSIADTPGIFYRIININDIVQRTCGHHVNDAPMPTMFYALHSSSQGTVLCLLAQPAAPCLCTLSTYLNPLTKIAGQARNRAPAKLEGAQRLSFAGWSDTFRAGRAAHTRVRRARAGRALTGWPPARQPRRPVGAAAGRENPGEPHAFQTFS
jgi:hypothetical protein